MITKDQELMERYIYQVIRRLPKEQQDEVSMELHELISDMMEESDSIEDVLTKLGNPADFAKKYLDGTHHLIGPKYYDTYLRFLKIILICTIVPILIISIVEGVYEGISATGTDHIGLIVNAVILAILGSLGNCISACIGIFGGVTLIFAIMERQNIKLDIKKEKEWSVNDLGDNFTGKKLWTPKNLAPIPHMKAIIGKSDSVLGIVFGVLLCVLLIFAPQFFSMILNSNGTIRTVPVFNLNQWNIILPLFVASIMIGLIDDVIRLIFGYYCRMVMVSNIICGVLQIALATILLKVLPFWNPDFWTKFTDWLKAFNSKEVDMLITFGDGMVSNIILAFICLIVIIEMIVTIYRTIRYGVETV